MTYLVTFCFIRGQVVLDGPEGFDVDSEFQRWRRKITERTGPEPNIACYGSHREWLLRYVETLKEYQREYGCLGDFVTLFVEHLVQRHGFQRREFRDVRLG